MKSYEILKILNDTLQPGKDKGSTQAVIDTRDLNKVATILESAFSNYRTVLETTLLVHERNHMIIDQLSREILPMITKQRKEIMDNMCIITLQSIDEIKSMMANKEKRTSPDAQTLGKTDEN